MERLFKRNSKQSIPFISKLTRKIKKEKPVLADKIMKKKNKLRL